MGKEAKQEVVGLDEIVVVRENRSGTYLRP
jgi:hypothetical protein